MQHAVRPDKVERCICERQRLRVGNAYVGSETFLLEAALYRPDRCGRKIDADGVRSPSHEADEVRTEPDADLEHVEVAPALELGKLGDERLELVPSQLHLREEFRCPRRRGRCLRAARLALPELTDALFEHLAHRATSNSSFSSCSACPERNRVRANSRPRRPISFASSGCARNHRTASARASGSSGGTTTPAPTDSTRRADSPAAASSTGRPTAMKSVSLEGTNCSKVGCDDNVTRSASLARRIGVISSSGTCAWKC